MPINDPLFAGKKRAFFSHKAIAGTALSANVLVLNPLDGTKFMGPAAPDILNNANSAQGQGEWATNLTVGANHLTGQHKYWLTSQALGMFGTMAAPSGTSTQVGGSGGDYQHYALVSSLGNTLLPHTIQESYRGSATTAQSYYTNAAICNGWTINVSRGNQFATITADLIGNSCATGTDLSSVDVAANMPIDVATPPTKCAMWIAATSTAHVTRYDGSVSVPTTAGTPFEDLGGEFKVSTYCPQYSIAFNNNINESDLFIAGTSTATGFTANTAAAYAVNRTLTVTATIDMNADATNLALMDFLGSFTNASQQSYTMQFTFVNDTQIASSGTYYGGTIIAPAMRVVSVAPSTNINGPLSLDVTFEGIADYANTGLALIFTWDGIATNYAALV